MSLHNFPCILISRSLLNLKEMYMAACRHKLTTPPHSPKQIKWPQMAATIHNYGRLLHHTQYARSRWCIVQCTPLHCNNFEFTIRLIVGLLRTALFQYSRICLIRHLKRIRKKWRIRRALMYLKCQEQRISKNWKSTFILCSSLNLWGGLIFYVTLARGRRAPLPPRQWCHCT